MNARDRKRVRQCFEKVLAVEKAGWSETSSEEWLFFFTHGPTGHQYRGRITSDSEVKGVMREGQREKDDTCIVVEELLASCLSGAGTRSPRPPLPGRVETGHTKIGVNDPIENRSKKKSSREKSSKGKSSKGKSSKGKSSKGKSSKGKFPKDAPSEEKEANKSGFRLRPHEDSSNWSENDRRGSNRERSRGGSNEPLLKRPLVERNLGRAASWARRHRLAIGIFTVGTAAVSGAVLSGGIAPASGIFGIGLVGALCTLFASDPARLFQKSGGGGGQ